MFLEMSWELLVFKTKVALEQRQRLRCNMANARQDSLGLALTSWSML